MRMTRYWMTGCMALVLLVAGRAPQRDEPEDDRLRERTRITLTSKYDVDETVRQIEASVRRSGLPVLARTAVKSARTAEDDAAPGPVETQVLVLGDEAGQTPALQADGQALPELPWTVMVSPLPDGQTQVTLSDPGALQPPEGVSAQTARKVATLPDVVKAAIS